VLVTAGCVTFALDKIGQIDFCFGMKYLNLNKRRLIHLHAFTCIKRAETHLVLEHATFKCNTVLIAKKQLLSFFKDTQRYNVLY